MLLAKAPPAKLRGLVRYTFLDEHDRPTYAHDQFGRRIVGGHWNSNLITDTGLNAVAVDRLRSYPSALGSDDQTWRAFLHVGTGSTAPAFTDAALVSKVQEGSSDGGFANIDTFNDPAAGEITAEFQITRVITLAADQNLTEYGFSTLTAGSLNIRELFRDEADNPITISIKAGKKIRVDHKLIVALPWGAQAQAFDIEEYDVSDALVDTHAMTANCLFVATTAAVRSAMFYSALPYHGVVSATKRFSIYTSAPSTDPLVEAAVTGDFSTLKDAYAPGSHKIRNYYTLGEAEHNVAIYGYVFRLLATTGSGIAPRQGYRVAFDTPATFTKADTHTLELAIELSWARG